MNRRAVLRSCAVIAILLLTARCGTVEPQEEDLLVVEAFVNADSPLPLITLRRAQVLGTFYREISSFGAEGADITFTLDGLRAEYEPVAGRSGVYRPVDPSIMAASGATFGLRVDWNGTDARAEGIIPPAVRLDSVHTMVPSRPVRAIALDSLRFDTTGVEHVFIYPVEVIVWWEGTSPADGPDSLLWIRAQLRPEASFSSAVINFFLRPEQVIREEAAPRDADGRRHWRGVYAVPVPDEDAPMPEHSLKISLVRSGRDYARYATSRNAPERREPVSNVHGAIGIAVGISVDSTRIHVRP
jgi:hypothetical protein